MNDRYLFHGKRTDNGEWITGNLIEDGVTGKVYIHAIGNSVNESDRVGEEGYLRFIAYEVDPLTVCQCTGLTDKNGKLIWENDIVSVIREDGFIEYAIIDYYISSMMSGFRMKPIEDWMCTSFDEVEVVGNIFDNPELLEAAEKSDTRSE